MIKGKKMSIYELRIYTLYVGKINEAKEIYQNHGWPAIKKYEEYLIYLVAAGGIMRDTSVNILFYLGATFAVVFVHEMVSASLKWLQ